MKITIYDLLGLIKNGKAPEKIKYQNYKWVWTGDDYKTIKGVNECFLITGEEYTWLTEFLNDEVEIIEEKPKHIKEIELGVLSPNGEYIISVHDEKIQDKINELTKAVNYLSDKDK